MQEQKLTELRKELEVVISERDNLKEEVERLRTEHRHSELFVGSHAFQIILLSSNNCKQYCFCLQHLYDIL